MAMSSWDGSGKIRHLFKPWSIMRVEEQKGVSLGPNLNIAQRRLATSYLDTREIKGTQLPPHCVSNICNCTHRTTNPRLQINLSNVLRMSILSATSKTGHTRSWVAEFSFVWSVHAGVCVLFLPWTDSHVVNICGKVRSLSRLD